MSIFSPSKCLVIYSPPQLARDLYPELKYSQGPDQQYLHKETWNLACMCEGSDISGDTVLAKVEHNEQLIDHTSLN